MTNRGGQRLRNGRTRARSAGVKPGLGGANLTRRRRLGWSQEAAAHHYLVPVLTYSKWERGQIDCPKKVAPLKNLKPHERAIIYRRRAGLRQADIAASLGCSRYWVHRMETGIENADNLILYWEV